MIGEQYEIISELVQALEERKIGKDNWGRGMWLDLSKKAKYEDFFISYVNMYKKSTITEEALNHQVYKVIWQAIPVLT